MNPYLLLHFGMFLGEAWWEEEILHRKYNTKKPKAYDLMTECVEYDRHIIFFEVFDRGILQLATGAVFGKILTENHD